METAKTYKIDFSKMLMDAGNTKKETKKLIKEHNEKVKENVRNGGTSYPCFLL